jgi:hypothetical protein
MSAFATRMTGSQDLFAARWDGGLPGGLAAARRPAFGVNALEPPLSGSLLHLAGAAEDLERAETVARSLLLAMLVAQVGWVTVDGGGWGWLFVILCHQHAAGTAVTGDPGGSSWAGETTTRCSLMPA